MKGRRYPLGIQTFKNIIEGNYVYVDKTDLIYELVHEKKYCFLSRPRRFGKSLLVTTLQAYLEGKKELFKGLKLEALEKDWEKHPVIHLDLSKGKYYNMESLIETLDKILETYEDLYQITSVSTEAFNVRLIRIINAAKQKTDRNVVVLIDEYDAPMHDSMKDKDLQDKIRDIMRNFFSPLKSEEDNLHFVFLTGISKFSQLSIFSELNNITNISMWDKYSSICGISKEELLENFHDDIEDLAQANDMNYEEALAELRYNYDGYHFSGKGADMYNPYSMFNCLETHEFDSYWFSTGTPTFLIELLTNIYNNVITCILWRKISHNRSVWRNYTSLPSLMKRCARASPTASSAIIPQTAWATVMYRYITIAFLHLQTFYRKFPYTLVNNNERHYQAVLYTILLILGCDVTPEVPTSDGRIDMVLKTKRSVYILELKYKKDAEAAMEQIDSKDYLAAFADDSRKKYKVGINFSEDRRSIDDWKVEALA